MEMRGNVAFLCSDDKAKVPVCEAIAPVSTGVRGKMPIAPVLTTLGALDHDMTKASLTPSVVLQCDIPEYSAKSFVRGKVTTVVNGAVFLSSNPFRHVAILVKLAEQEDVKVMMKALLNEIITEVCLRSVAVSLKLEPLRKRNLTSKQSEADKDEIYLACQRYQQTQPTCSVKDVRHRRFETMPGIISHLERGPSSHVGQRLHPRCHWRRN